MTSANGAATESNGDTKGSTKSLEGKIETDDKFGYLAELIAYKALRDSVIAVAEDIQKKLPPKPTTTAADVVAAAAAAAAATLAVSDQAKAVATAISKDPWVSPGDRDAANHLAAAAQKAVEGVHLAQTKAQEATAAAAAVNSHTLLLTPDPNSPPTKILILNTLDVIQSYVPLVQINAQFDSIAALMKAQIEENKGVIHELTVPSHIDVGTMGITAGITAGITTVTTVVSLIADLVGYFKTDISIKGQRFSMKNETLAPIIASHLRDTGGHDVFIGNFRWMENSHIVTTFTNLLKERTELASTKDQLEDLKKALNKETEDTNPTPEQQNKLDKITAAATESTSLIDAFDGLSKAITQIGENQDASLLASAAIAEQTQKLGITHLLYLSIISSGGEAIIERKALDLSPDTAFVGGVVFSYILARVSGEVIASDTIPVLAHMVYKFSAEDKQLEPRTIWG